MNAINYNSKYPKSIILLIATLLITMIASKCAAQTIPTDTAVLKYLYKRAEIANYLETDTANLQKIISSKSEIIKYKDSVIYNRGEALSVANNIAALTELQLKATENNLAQSNKKSTFFKLTTYLVGIVGSITTGVAYFR